MKKMEAQADLLTSCSAHFGEDTEGHQEKASEEAVRDHPQGSKLAASRGPGKHRGHGQGCATGTASQQPLLRDKITCATVWDLGFGAASHSPPAPRTPHHIGAGPPAAEGPVLPRSPLLFPEPTSSRPTLTLLELIWNLLICISKEIK